MVSDKDIEQDALIRQNAEHIRRNEEAILRQTAALEKIRDHYFPRQSVWKKTLGFFLKVVGAVTVAAGLLETGDWYWNTRQSEAMAKESAAVAKRLFFGESNPAGAMRFLEKAVELDGGNVRYRIALAYVKGLATVAELFDLGRPLTKAERERVDACLAEAVFLQQSAADEAMPHILSAQAYMLRGEAELARKSVENAVARDSESLPVRFSACAVMMTLGDCTSARGHLASAAALDAEHPFVFYWKGVLAGLADHDWRTARTAFEDALRRAPNLGLAHLMLGRAIMQDEKPDLAAARAALQRAIAVQPKMNKARLFLSETYEREGNLELARLWLDQVLKQDAACMGALTARARLAGKSGDWKSAEEDLSAAIALAPFRADLYRERGMALGKTGDEAGAAADLRRAEALERK